MLIVVVRKTHFEYQGHQFITGAPGTLEEAPEWLKDDPHFVMALSAGSIKLFDPLPAKEVEPEVPKETEVPAQLQNVATEVITEVLTTIPPMTRTRRRGLPQDEPVPVQPIQ